MTIREAIITDIQDLAPLFDGYRQFYKQASDLQKGKKFLEERIIRKESVIYMALVKAKPIGFTQLYPLFSSVSMEPMYLLNDLFILPEYRGKGIGTALIDVVKERCTLENLKGIALQTGPTNPAQKLYEHLGFIKDRDLHYFWTTQ